VGAATGGVAGEEMSAGFAVARREFGANDAEEIAMAKRAVATDRGRFMV
jgi:hypothetical protein